MGGEWSDWADDAPDGTPAVTNAAWVTWGGSVRFNGVPDGIWREVARARYRVPAKWHIQLDIPTTADVDVRILGGLGKSQGERDEIITTGPTTEERRACGVEVRVLARQHAGGAVAPWTFTASIVGDGWVP